MDSIFWEVDLTTAVTVDGVARPAPEDLIRLGLSRGTRVSRPKQIDFLQRFMSMPFVPSFSNSNGLSFHRLISLHLPLFARNTWYALPILSMFNYSKTNCVCGFPTLLGRFDVHKFTSSLPPRQSQQQENSDASFLYTIWTHVLNPSFYALNFCSEWFLLPEDTLLLSLEKCGSDDIIPRKKLCDHNLTIEAASPTLFVDGLGNYWDVPFTLGLDFSSLLSFDSGMSCHFCINHTSGSPHKYDTNPKNFDTWKSEIPKTKLVQPYDIFFSNPHISASAIIDDGMDVYYMHFRRSFLDLTRINARVDVPSMSKFVVGASRLAMDLYNSRQAPSVEEIQAICHSANLSIQHKINSTGFLYFRIAVVYECDNDLVYAVEYALQVLGSAKAVAWYSPTQREFMIELRFFET
ncbi:hypothetical protein ABFX02_03G025050 [Erythranthe guttata]